MAARLEELILQPTKTTREVEKIKSAVSITEWSAKEHRTVRRIKLDELAHYE